MSFFYIQYTVIGGVKGLNGIKSVIVKSVDVAAAETFVREKFAETGRKVLIMQGLVATIEQLRSNRIPIYT